MITFNERASKLLGKDLANGRKLAASKKPVIPNVKITHRGQQILNDIKK